MKAKLCRHSGPEVCKSMATILDETQLDQSKDETPLYASPSLFLHTTNCLHRETAAALMTPKTFSLFPLLPAELQLLIWDHCVSNTFVTYQRLKQSSSRALTSATSPPEPLYVDHRRLCKRRWMRLMLTCKTSYEVAKKADADFRRKEPKKYWIFGRKWEEMAEFHQNGLLSPYKGVSLGKFDEDADFRW